MLFPILGIHNVGSLFGPVDAILVERAGTLCFSSMVLKNAQTRCRPARLTPASSTECSWFAIFHLVFSLEIKAHNRARKPFDRVGEMANSEWELVTRPTAGDPISTAMTSSQSRGRPIHASRIRTSYCHWSANMRDRAGRTQTINFVLPETEFF